MPERADLVVDAQHLVDEYRELANKVPAAAELQHVGLVLDRALEALEHEGREAIQRALTELASARSTLAAVRRAIR
jgi:P2-related tail formation protein